MKLIQHLRSFVIDRAAGGMNWANDAFLVAHEDSLRYALGVWIERQFSRLFSLAYSGSDEEITGVFDIPLAHMSERQLKHVFPDLWDLGAHCNECNWAGTGGDAWEAYNLCPNCSDDCVWIEEFPRTAPRCTRVAKPLLLTWPAEKEGAS